MASVYDPENFSGRVNYAAQVISRGGAQTSHFDTCFEMNDGDVVAAAIYRRSLKNPRLAKNLSRYLRLESIQQANDRVKHVPTRRLATAAAQARYPAKE